MLGLKQLLTVKVRVCQMLKMMTMLLHLTKLLMRVYQKIQLKECLLKGTPVKKVPFPLLGSESQGRSRGLGGRGGEGRGGQFSWVPVYSLLTSDQGCH